MGAHPVHLVLVHGSRLSRAQWSPQLPLLEGHVTIGLVDLPGHGSRAGEPFTLARCAEVIAQEAGRAPAGSRVVVAGHSLGGYAAMGYAASTLRSSPLVPRTEPSRGPRTGPGSRLDGLVLAGCSTTPTGPGAGVYRGVAALTDRLGPQRMTRVNDRLLRRFYPAEVVEPVIAGGYYFEPTAAAWHEVMTHCRPSMLAGLRCPVLILNGQFDQFRWGTKAFTRVLPQARVEVIRRATHLSSLDQPAAFADALVRFCAGVGDSAGAR